MSATQTSVQTSQIPHTVVSRDEWLAARESLLTKEKELTRLRDQLSAARRALPWVKVDKEYVFDTPQGRRTFGELFQGRNQLIVYHFMWRHDLNDGCVGCSFLSDHIDGANQHLRQHDVTLVVVSRAPLPTLAAYKKRMGWQFDWVSSWGSDFNYDYNVSFTPQQLASGQVFYNFRTTQAPTIEDLSGFSVFYRDTNGDIFHTYSSYARGNEEVLGTYMYLDLTPKGRNENGPQHNLTDWVRHHDRYGVTGHIDVEGGFVPEQESPGCCATHDQRSGERS
jgi:predicted dithiol-disulfide oxidoreductase (DUF899 family)